MRASQLPTLTSVLITAAFLTALSSMMEPWAPSKAARESWLSWGQPPWQPISATAAALWIVLAGLIGGWLGSAMSLPSAAWKRVGLLVLFCLLQLSLAGTLAMLGWTGEPFTAIAAAMACFVLSLLLNHKRHQRLRQLRQLGLLSRVSTQRIHDWLDCKKDLTFPKTSTVASLVTVSVKNEPAQGQRMLLNKALAFFMHKGGCLEAVGSQHLQLWFGFPQEKCYPGRQASRALQAWRESQPDSAVWQGSVVTGSIDVATLGIGEAIQLKAVGPWTEIGRIATTHSEQIVIDEGTHEMLDEDSWICHPITCGESTWYELRAETLEPETNAYAQSS